MESSWNWGSPKSFALIGFSLINHPFGGTPIDGTPQIFPDLFASEATLALAQRLGAKDFALQEAASMAAARKEQLELSKGADHSGSMGESKVQLVGFILWGYYNTVAYIYMYMYIYIYIDSK